MVKTIKYIEVTAWLVSVYDFYAQFVKDCKRTSEWSERVSLAIFQNKWCRYQLGVILLLHPVTTVIRNIVYVFICNIVTKIIKLN
jgi:hypothetical protein